MTHILVCKYYIDLVINIHVMRSSDLPQAYSDQLFFLNNELFFLILIFRSCYIVYSWTMFSKDCNVAPVAMETFFLKFNTRFNAWLYTRCG